MPRFRNSLETVMLSLQSNFRSVDRLNRSLAGSSSVCFGRALQVGVQTALGSNSLRMVGRAASAKTYSCSFEAQCWQVALRCRPQSTGTREGRQVVQALRSENPYRTSGFVLRPAGFETWPTPKTNGHANQGKHIVKHGCCL